MKNPEKSDVYYESVRDEIIERLRMRDNCLIIYIGFVGAFFAFMVDKYASKLIGISASVEKCADLAGVMLLSLAMPVLCLVFALMVLQHHIIMFDLHKFLVNEWHNANGKPVHWNASEERRKSTRATTVMRAWGQALVLILPLLLQILISALLSNHINLCNYVLWAQLSSYYYAFTILVVVALHLYAYWYRK